MLTAAWEIKYNKSTFSYKKLMQQFSDVKNDYCEFLSALVNTIGIPFWFSQWGK